MANLRNRNQKMNFCNFPFLVKKRVVRNLRNEEEHVCILDVHISFTANKYADACDTPEARIDLDVDHIFLSTDTHSQHDLRDLLQVGEPFFWDSLMEKAYRVAHEELFCDEPYQDFTGDDMMEMVIKQNTAIINSLFKGGAA
jgi:hypothetical protein